jgi:hypothetical protein
MLLQLGIGLLLVMVALGLSGCVPIDTQEVLIESAESKTAELTPVYNKITWHPGDKQDVWMMNQSHFGAQAKPSQWERLAIVIDKTKTPKVARFYQIKAGQLVWEESLVNQRVGYRANCFICHNNGPRAIRPVSDSPNAFLNWRERLKIQAWNLRIKAYGRIVYDPQHDVEDSRLQVPFAYHSPRSNDFLKVKTCVLCHQEDGWIRRGFLRRQQTGTIRSLVERGEMPPRGFELSDQEKRELEDFLRGF